jgi:hypothetical protein
MQHLEVSGAVVLYIGRTVSKDCGLVAALFFLVNLAHCQLASRVNVVM